MQFLLWRTIVLALVFAGGAIIGLPASNPTSAIQAPEPVALTGLVSSPDEGPMEGVLVTVRRDGAPFSVTVTSGKDGRYRFPKTHLEPGRYSVEVRAIVYDLDASPAVDVMRDAPATVDLTLRQTRDLAAQLTSLEWVMSAPGTPKQKSDLVRQVVNCGFCHTLEQVVRSRHTAEEWIPVIERMATYHPDFSGSRRIQTWGGLGPSDMWWETPVEELAGYLATINLSKGGHVDVSVAHPAAPEGALHARNRHGV